MKPKYKVTGCARFVVFFIIFIPLVFFGAAYMRGENGVKIIKDFYHSVVGKPAATPDTKPTTQDRHDDNACEIELKAAQDKIQALEEELKIKEAVIKELKN